MNALMIPAAGYGIVAMGSGSGLQRSFPGRWMAKLYKDAFSVVPAQSSWEADGDLRLMLPVRICYVLDFGGMSRSPTMDGEALFLIAPIILSIIAFLPLLFGKNRPEDANLPPIEIYEQHGTFAGMSVDQMRAKIGPKNEKEEHAGFAFTVKRTLGKSQSLGCCMVFLFSGHHLL